ncbi:MAG: branched-chain amino acid ABC transporter substrate-binding protein [Candidatus Melainabacteria bacterium]|jgi:branched-chain amino acid transport system substrate-binding protein|nr:branched-chain amino acid ABC transporter substrate-binding protein [Candidatus Melainabacteria bacterium]
MMTIQKLITRPLLLILLVGLSLSLLSCSKQTSQDSISASQTSEHTDAEEPLEIATIEGNHYIAIAAPLTGPYKELGNSIVEGASLAVEEFNQTEGDEKHKIGTLIIDDGGLVSEGLARADLVIAQNALGVVGHLNSAISIETSKKYSQSGIAEISPASTNPKLTERTDIKGYVYRTIGTDRQLGDVAARYVISNPKFKRVAVLYNDRAYGVSVASEFVRVLARDQEKEIVLYQAIPVRTNDHTATASKVAETKADLVFFIGEYNDAAYLVKELKNISPKTQFFAAEGVHHQTFIDLAQGVAEGALVIGTAPAPDFIRERYKKRYKKESSGYVGTSYRATMLLLQAIKANKYKNPESIAETLGENKIFDPNGDLIEPDFVIYTVKNSRFSS